MDINLAYLCLCAYHLSKSSIPLKVHHYMDMMVFALGKLISYLVIALDTHALLTHPQEEPSPYNSAIAIQP